MILSFSPSPTSVFFSFFFLSPFLQRCEERLGVEVVRGA